jgi:two-component system sensor histidine kinase DesK
MHRLWAGPWIPPDQGRMPYFWLLSLGYMFWKFAYVRPGAVEVALLVLTFAVFIPLYCASYRARGWQIVACMLAGCLIGAAWVRWNVGSATFFIFACAMAGQIVQMRRAMLAIGVVIVLALLTSLQIDGTQMRLLFVMPILTISLPVGLGAVMDARLRARASSCCASRKRSSTSPASPSANASRATCTICWATRCR